MCNPSQPWLCVFVIQVDLESKKSYALCFVPTPAMIDSPQKNGKFYIVSVLC